MTPNQLAVQLTSGSLLQQVISNGTVELGINGEGHLNANGVGLLYVPTGGDATLPGCACEGWGVADAAAGLAGYANVAVGGVQNLDLISFETTAETATSVVRLGDRFEVTHAYHPSSEESLYQADVTVSNLTQEAIPDVRYRRVLDWDIFPTPFDEFVTVQGSTLPGVLFASNDGFATANPLGPRSDRGLVGDFIDGGPDDHGVVGFSLPWSSIDGGGGMRSTGGPFAVSGTIGQPDAGPTQADLYLPWLAPWERFEKVEYADEGEAEGEPAHHLRVHAGDGGVQDWWLSAATHQVVKITRSLTAPDGQQITFDTYQLEYGVVEGLTFPHYVEMDYGTQIASETPESIEVNPELSGDLLVIPEE